MLETQFKVFSNNIPMLCWTVNPAGTVDYNSLNLAILLHTINPDIRHPRTTQKIFIN